MRKAVHKLVILAVVAVMAFGNGLSFAAAATFVQHDAHSTHTSANDHHASDHHASAGHIHANLASHSGHTDMPGEHCLGADCDDSDHANHPCCHTHAHCCTSLVNLTFDDTSSDPILGKGALLVAARGSVPLGAISYPLLRPPRLSA